MVAINLTEGHKKSIYGSLGINFVEQSQREIRRTISHLYSYKVHCSTYILLIYPDGGLTSQGCERFNF